MRIRPTDGANPGERVETAPFARPRSTDHLFWLDDGRHGGPPFYHAYLVQFEDRQGDNLTFHFLSVADASDIPGSYTIDVKDSALVLDTLPSTIPQFDGRPLAGMDCGFLFLDHFALDRGNPAMKLSADISGGGGGTGKYPKSG